MANKIQVTDYYIQIIADNQDADFLRLLSLVDGIEAMRSKNTYRCSLRKIREVLYILRGIEDSSTLTDNIKLLYENEIVRSSQTEFLKEFGTSTNSDWLWPHQCLGIDLARVNRRYNFFYDTRTGKTPMALKIMYEALSEQRARRCLVICPSAIIQSWQADANKWFPQMKVATYYGTPAQKQKALSTPAHIVLWSAEILINTSELLKKIPFDLCFFDESSKLKNYSSQISKATLELSKTIPRWYNLSATPAPNGEYEYYTQMLLVDPYVFNNARTKFVLKYFDNISRSKNYEKLVIKPNMKAEFTDIIQSYSLYVDQAVMPTAGKEWHTVTYPLTSSTVETYNKMCSEMAAEVEGALITADMAAAMRAKLNQITSGFLMDTNAIKENKISKMLKEDEELTEIYRLGDNTRIETLSKLLKSFGNEKVVIWANYKQEFKMIEELLGRSARYIRGGSSIGEKEQCIKEFKQGSLQYLVCHPLSLGFGVNLTESHIAVYYSLNDSWEAFKQSSERIYGHINVQASKCHYYILQAKETVNELIYKNIMNKRDLSTGLLDHLKVGVLYDRT